MLCHGNGNPDAPQPGCCYVEGAVCPLRWELRAGHVWDHQGNDLGTIDAAVAAYTNSPPKQQRIKDQLQGVVWVCKAAAQVIGDDSKLLNDRAALNAAWNQHADYVALVRPAWARIEQELGLPEGAYQCSTWKGTGGPQCCFTEDQATNDSKAANLHLDGRSVRQAGGQ